MAEVERRHYPVVQIQQQAQAITLVFKLLLECLGSLVAECVVHGHGHLPGHRLKKFHPRLAISSHPLAAKSHRAQPLVRSGERQNAKRSDFEFVERFHRLLEARLLVNVGHNQGFLTLPNPTGRGIFNVALDKIQISARWRLKDVDTHDIPVGVMQDQPERVKIHQPRQPSLEVMKQCRQVTVGGNGFRNLEQNLMLRGGRPKGNARFLGGSIGHQPENTTNRRQESGV